MKKVCVYLDFTKKKKKSFKIKLFFLNLKKYKQCHKRRVKDFFFPIILHSIAKDINKKLIDEIVEMWCIGMHAHKNVHTLLETCMLS
jgi:hypothetical protein